jgi:hypothetical protein
MPDKTKNSSTSPEPVSDKDFLRRISLLFSTDSPPSNLFAEVSERLAKQSATGELRRLTQHEVW